MIKTLFLILFLPAISSAQTPAEPRVSTQKIIVHTTLGNMTIGLFPDVAPQHVEQIVRLAKAGGYDGTRIFRIEPQFVAQIENFNAREVPLPRDLQATIRKLPAEFSNIPHVRGILSMARFDDPNSAESSFSFVLGRSPHLDRNYTVFGKILEGMEVLDAIEKVYTYPDHRPTQDVRIVSADVVGEPDVPAADPTIVRWLVCIVMVIIVATGLVSTLWERRSKRPIV